MVRPAIPAPMMTTSAVVFSCSAGKVGGAGAVVSQLDSVAPEVRVGSTEADMVVAKQEENQTEHSPAYAPSLDGVQVELSITWAIKALATYLGKWQ